MSTTDIMTAAFEKLQAFVYSPQPEILWPGIQETPPDKGMWLAVRFFPNKPDNFAWDNDACVHSLGFVQVSVYYRPGQGQVDPSELADALIAHFAKGDALGPVRISERPWQSPSIDEDASKSFIPITIPYLGLT